MEGTFPLVFSTVPERSSLRKHGYPPDKQGKATQTVLEQVGARSEAWVAAA